jgi:heptosyltransferase-3/putative inorganic carbon (HCO3(-)) transporter
MKIENAAGDASPSAAGTIPGSLHSRSMIVQLQTYGLAAITFLCFFPGLYHIQEYAFAVLLVAALSFAWVEKINPHVRTRLDAPLMAFVGWVLFTVPFAVDPLYSFSEWRKVVAHLLVFYWAMFVLRVHGDGEPTRKVLLGVVLGSLALSLFALQDFVVRGGSWRDRQIRAAAPSSDYNWLTTYLVLVIPILIGWLLTQSSRVARALGSLSLASSLLAQVAAYTRAGWVAHFIQALAFVLVVRRQRFILWFLAGAIFAGSALMALSIGGFQKETTDPWTFSARLKTWRLGIQQVVEHPIVGIGFGNNTFSKAYAAEIEADKTKGPTEKVLPALHNTFAMILMGSGVPAVIFFVWIIVRALRELLAGVASGFPRSVPVMLRTAIALAIIGFVIRNLFDYMFAGSLASLFWILLALGFSLNDGRSSRSAAV